MVVWYHGTKTRYEYTPTQIQTSNPICGDTLCNATNPIQLYSSVLTHKAEGSQSGTLASATRCPPSPTSEARNSGQPVSAERRRGARMVRPTTSVRLSALLFACEGIAYMVFSYMALRVLQC